MKRILERIDSDGDSFFIPQHKFLGLFWTGYEGYPFGDICFGSYDQCKRWLTYNKKVTEIIHEAGGITMIESRLGTLLKTYLSLIHISNDAYHIREDVKKEIAWLRRVIEKELEE